MADADLALQIAQAQRRSAASRLLDAEGAVRRAQERVAKAQREYDQAEADIQKILDTPKEVP